VCIIRYNLFSQSSLETNQPTVRAFPQKEIVVSQNPVVLILRILLTHSLTRRVVSALSTSTSTSTSWDHDCCDDVGGNNGVDVDVSSSSRGTGRADTVKE